MGPLLGPRYIPYTYMDPLEVSKFGGLGMRFKVQGVGGLLFRVERLNRGASSLGCAAWGLGLKVECVGFRARSLGFKSLV